MQTPCDSLLLLLRLFWPVSLFSFFFWPIQFWLWSSRDILCVCFWRFVVRVCVWCVCESLCVCFDARICYENWIRLAKRTSSSWYDCICLPACLLLLHVACCMWHAADSILKFLWHAIWLTAARCINYVKLFNRIKAGAVHDRDWITEGLNYIYVGYI